MYSRYDVEIQDDKAVWTFFEDISEDIFKTKDYLNAIEGLEFGGTDYPEANFAGHGNHAMSLEDDFPYLKLERFRCRTKEGNLFIINEKETFLKEVPKWYRHPDSNKIVPLIIT